MMPIKMIIITGDHCHCIQFQVIEAGLGLTLPKYYSGGEGGNHDNYHDKHHDEHHGNHHGNHHGKRQNNQYYIEEEGEIKKSVICSKSIVTLMMHKICQNNLQYPKNGKKIVFLLLLLKIKMTMGGGFL